MVFNHLFYLGSTFFSVYPRTNSHSHHGEISGNVVPISKMEPATYSSRPRCHRNKYYQFSQISLMVLKPHKCKYVVIKTLQSSRFLYMNKFLNRLHAHPWQVFLAFPTYFFHSLAIFRIAKPLKNFQINDVVFPEKNFGYGLCGSI